MQCSFWMIYFLLRSDSVTDLANKTAAMSRKWLNQNRISTLLILLAGIPNPTLFKRKSLSLAQQPYPECIWPTYIRLCILIISKCSWWWRNVKQKYEHCLIKLNCIFCLILITLENYVKNFTYTRIVIMKSKWIILFCKLDIQLLITK